MYTKKQNPMEVSLWDIFDPSGEKVWTHFTEADADANLNELNKLYGFEKEPKDIQTVFSHMIKSKKPNISSI